MSQAFSDNREAEELCFQRITPCFTTTRLQEKGLQEMTSIFSTDKIIRSGNTITEANRWIFPSSSLHPSNIPQKATVPYLYTSNAGGQNIPSMYLYLVDGQIIRESVASTHSMGFTCNQKIK